MISLKFSYDCSVSSIIGDVFLQTKCYLVDKFIRHGSILTQVKQSLKLLYPKLLL